jgi:hypothetical protein
MRTHERSRDHRGVSDALVVIYTGVELLLGLWVEASAGPCACVIPPLFREWRTGRTTLGNCLSPALCVFHMESAALSDNK